MKSSVLHSLMKALNFLANSVLPLFFWTFLIFGFDSPVVAFLTIIAAAIHELGHLLGGACAGSARLRAHLSGFRIRLGSFGYERDIIALAAGPLTNLAIYMVTLLFGGALGGYVSLFGYVNLMTALSNLLPAPGYDGYGIIKKLLEARELERGLIALDRASFAVCAILTLLSLYLLLRYGEGYWIFGVFFLMMTGKIKDCVKRDILRE